MKTSRFLRAGTTIIAVLAFCFLPHALIRAQENSASAHSAGSPPRYINVVHERLKPGRDAAYDGMLSNIRDDYERCNIPAYWSDMKSITGPDETFSLNFGDSFGDLEKMGAGMAAAVTAHPELAGLQDRQLAENTSSVTNLIAERVDPLSFHAGSINFAKMRMLQVTVFHIRPGHEGEFAEAAKSIASAYEKVAGSPPWVIYAVHSGVPVPCYLMLTALSSLKDEDDAAARRAPAMEAAGAAVEQRLQEIARSAYDSVETNFYVVNPLLSHMPRDFTAEDPAYWMPRTAPVAATKD